MRIHGSDIAYSVTGVYALMHMPSEDAYVGGTTLCLYRRFTWHMSKLSKGSHTSVYLLKRWLETDPSDWRFVILELCSKDQIIVAENYWIKKIGNLNYVKDATGKTKRLSDETKQKQRESRARYLETPGARESLSERAKKQWSGGNFGRKSYDPTYCQVCGKRSPKKFCSVECAQKSWKLT